MKKAVLAATALFVAATATPVMAAEFSYGGFMRFRGIWIDPGTANSIWGGAPNETNDRFEYRVRQFFNLKVNEHVTTNVKFEWNSQFGDEQQIAAGAGDLQFGDTGASPNEVQFRIKNAFVQFDVPGVPVSLTVGQQDFSTPKALINVEDGTGVKANVKFAPVDLTLFWQKNVNGGDNATGVDDAHWFGAVPSFEVADITIAPHVSYFTTGAGLTAPAGSSPATQAVYAALRDAEVWFLGVDSTGKIGPAGFTFDFIYQTGDTGAPTSVDVASFILDASASLEAGPGTATVKVLYSPGDDNIATGDVDSWINIVGTDLGWSPFFHDGTSISGFAGLLTPGIDGVGSGGLAANGGIIAVGLEYALSPYRDLTVTPNAYYLMADEDINAAGGGAGRADDFYGIEAGIQANWKVWDAVTLLAQFDYLFAGDVFEDATGDTKDAWRVVIGPTLSW